MNKKLEPTGDLCIKFTDDELLKLNLKEGDKLNCKFNENGILFEKYETIELDLNEFSKEILILLVKESCDKDISISEVISNIIEDTIKDM